MIPVVVTTAEVVLRLVPGGLREASLALGTTQWQTVRRVVLPTARSGLVTAVLLGVARVIGEPPVLTPEAGGLSIALADANRAADVLIALRQASLGIATASVRQPTLRRQLGLSRCRRRSLRSSRAGRRPAAPAPAPTVWSRAPNRTGPTSAAPVG